MSDRISMKEHLHIITPLIIIIQDSRHYHTINYHQPIIQVASKGGNTLADKINQLLHLVFAVLAVVVLEVEVLTQKFLQDPHIEEVAKVDPLLAVLLVDGFLPQELALDDGVALNKVDEGVRRLLDHLVDVAELVADDGLFFDEEVLHILEGGTVDEVLPVLELILVVALLDDLTELVIELFGDVSDLA